MWDQLRSRNANPVCQPDKSSTHRHLSIRDTLLLPVHFTLIRSAHLCHQTYPCYFSLLISPTTCPRTDSLGPHAVTNSLATLNTCDCHLVPEIASDSSHRKEPPGQIHHAKTNSFQGSGVHTPLRQCPWAHVLCLDVRGSEAVPSHVRQGLGMLRPSFRGLMLQSCGHSPPWRWWALAYGTWSPA